MNGISFVAHFLRFRKLFSEEDPPDSFYQCHRRAFDKFSIQLEHIIETPSPSPMVSWHFCIYVYRLSRELYLDGASQEATYAFLVNKMANATDLFYEIDLHDHFLLAHNVGSVFAKATYSNFFVVHQGVTIGRYLQDRPIIESDVVLYPCSMIIGRSHVRENSVVSAGTKIIGKSTPGNCIVFEAKSGKLKFKALDKIYTDRFFIRTNHVKPPDLELRDM